MLKTHWTTQTARSVSFQTNPLFLFYYFIFLLPNGSFIPSPLRPSGNVCFTFTLQQFQQINEGHNIVLGPMLIILQDVGRYRLTFYSNVTLTHSMLKNYGRTSSRHLDRDVITWQESLKMRGHETFMDKVLWNPTVKHMLSFKHGRKNLTLDLRT